MRSFPTSVLSSSIADLWLLMDRETPKKLVSRVFPVSNKKILEFFLFQTHFRPRLVTWLPPSWSQPEILTRGVLLIFESPTSLHAKVSNFRFVLIYSWSLTFEVSINPKKISF